jgi:hypothetical protein
MPWLALAAFALVMLAVATLAAALTSRQAMRGDVVRAVREDW